MHWSLKNNETTTTKNTRIAMHRFWEFSPKEMRACIWFNAYIYDFSLACSPVMCMMYCQHGFAKDSRGCYVCRCARAPYKPGKCPSGGPTSDVACTEDLDCLGTMKCCNKKCSLPVNHGTIRYVIRDLITPRTHGNVFLRFCIVYCSQGNREQPAHYFKQYKNACFRVYGA